MTQEDKQLLLVDLCARLPYGVKCKHRFSDYIEKLDGIKYENRFCYFQDCEPCLIEDIKPYLFPMSSMTPKQKAELLMFVVGVADIFKAFLIEIEFYHKHHIDYRGLIPMGLALDATNKNIYSL